MSNNISLSNELIEIFRDKVNEHNWMSYKLKNVNGKNYWNILCSAMDWVEVAVEGLPTIGLERKGFGVDFEDTIKLMQYIILIDVLVESIIQMYRVIEGPEAYPYKGDKSIFHQSQLSDDIYFKHLRAAFSTHPVNLTSIDGVKTTTNERFYASWVSKFGLNEDGSTDDYFVSLYSNDPAKDENIFLGLKIDVVNNYAISRYQLMQDLIAKVDTIKQNHIVECKSKLIDTLQNPKEQLEILKIENESRFGSNEAYSGTIEYLSKLVEIDIKNYGLSDFYILIFNEYKDSLLPGVNVIKNALQNMERGMFYIDRNWTGYEFQKISQYLSVGENELGERYFHTLIKMGQLPKELIEHKDFILNRMLFDAYFYNLRKELKKERIAVEDIFQNLEERKDKKPTES